MDPYWTLCHGYAKYRPIYIQQDKEVRPQVPLRRFYLEHALLYRDIFLFCAHNMHILAPHIPHRLLSKQDSTFL